MKINKFNEIFNFKKSKKTESLVFKSKIEECAHDVIEFLKSNNIYTWNQFISGTRYDFFVISQIIDKYCDNVQEVNQVKYLMKLEMGEKEELEELLKEYEEKEEYEKCSEIKKKLDSL